MSKVANYSGVNTTAAFNTALKSVFSGIAAKQDQIQQLIVAAVNKASEANDFDWLSRIAVCIEDTRGLKLAAFSDWVKAHIVTEEGKPALDWQSDKRSFKLAQKGSAWKCLPITLKWYEMGKKQKMEDVYSLTGALEKLLHAAAAKQKKGELSATDAELLNKIAGMTAQFKAEQMAQVMAVQAADPAAF